MATVSAPEPRIEAALRASYEALREVAAFTLDPSLDQRMLELGEGKEFLDEGEHRALLALADFTQRRTAEKLRAQLALRQIEALYPEWAAGQ
jgi:hypothetical protein